MKDQYLQIEFLDATLLPIFGFKSIVDYQFYVSLKMVAANSNLLAQLNNQLENIKKLFPIADFNLHKTNGVISTFSKAIAVLKKCLFIAGVPFEMTRIKNTNYLHLLQDNKHLQQYIKIHHALANITESTAKCDEKNIGYEQIVEAVKKSFYKDLEFLSAECYNKTRRMFCIELPLENIRSILVTNSELIGAHYTIETDRRQVLISGVITGEKLFDTILPFEMCVYTRIFLNIYASCCLDTIKISLNTIIFKKKFNGTLGNACLNINVANNVIQFGAGTCTCRYVHDN